MHKIKRAARSSAWYSEDDGGTKTYNPFGRFNPRPRHGADEENQIRHTSTENAVSSPIEDQRRSVAREENAPFDRPGKSSTYPGPGGSRGDNSVWTDKTSGEGEDTDTIDSAALRDIPPQSFTEKSVGTNGDGRKAIKRRKFMIFGKKDQGASDSEAQSHEPDDKKKHYPKLSATSQLKAVFGSWINILLVFVPAGIALNYALDDGHTSRIIVFVVNFIAIIPLAAMLSYSTEELAMYIGEVLGGLLNATFGNAVELIVSIISLTQQKVLIVQTSLIGSMLSNLLLVMGMCFFCGGINRPEQHFNLTVAQTAASLLALAIGSLIIPTAYQIFADNDSGVVPTSRGTAVLLLVTYACYLLFQLRTHVDIYNEPSEKVPKRDNGKRDAGDTQKGIAMIGVATGAATMGGRFSKDDLVRKEDDGGETPNLTRLGALLTLVISTVFIALCAEFMVSAIDAVSDDVSPEFIGLILLPIVGNAAEHATAVTVAIKDKMDLAIGVAVGSSLQIALLVLPIMVMLNWWGVGSPSVLDFYFDGWLVVVLVIAIWLVNYLINDGKSHWLEGVMLMITYLIIALSAWFYPAPAEVAG